MRKTFLFLLPLLANLQTESMLYQAEMLAKRFGFETVKEVSPSEKNRTEQCLDTASVWFSIDLSEIQAPAFDNLNDSVLWGHLQEIGIEAVRFNGLKSGGKFRTAISLDPKWGANWGALCQTIQNKGMVVVADGIGNSTGTGADFKLALKNVGDYPSLYQLIEIAKEDWDLLPKESASLSWQFVADLKEKGYISEGNQWNVTGKIKGADEQNRRWIYQKSLGVDPVMNWLNPTFAAAKIASADALDSIYNIGAKILVFDAELPMNVTQTLALWTRKLGGFSAIDNADGIEAMKKANADLTVDTITRQALSDAISLHDASVLKLIYSLFLKEGIEVKKLIHAMGPFTAMKSPVLNDLLKLRKIKQDAWKIRGKDLVSWPKSIDTAMATEAEILETQLLTAFFLSMQPGVFSFSATDLLGNLTKAPMNLSGQNEKTLYASIAGQLGNGKSFARQLRRMIQVRRENQLSKNELSAVLNTKHSGLLLLLFKKPNSSVQELLAVNFGKEAVQETIELASIRKTTAIDLMNSLVINKPLESATIQLHIPARQATAILFQPKVFD